MVSHALLKADPSRKPIVAAVNGDCVGGGVELLLATDVRAAAPHARFGLPEVRWSIYPFGGATIKLIQQIGHVHAMDLLLSGRLIDAEEAARLGLVNRVVPASELMAWALETAETIAANSPSAVQAVKRQISATIADHARAARRSSRSWATRVRASPHFAEGVAAFREKRAATLPMSDDLRPASRTLGDLIDELAAARPDAGGPGGGDRAPRSRRARRARRRVRPRAPRGRRGPGRSRRHPAAEPPRVGRGRARHRQAWRRRPGRDQHVLDAAGARVGARTLRRHGARQPCRVPRPPFPRIRSGELCPELAAARPGLQSAALPALARRGHGGRRAHPAPSAWRRSPRAAAMAIRAPAARRGARRAVAPDDLCLHPLHLGIDGDAQGRAPRRTAALLANGFDIGERQHLTARPTGCGSPCRCSGRSAPPTRCRRS